MDNFHDVEFEEVKDEDPKEKQIRGSVLYYNTNQVASILGIPDSTVRYYSKVFDDILNIEIINKQRKYKQSDIDKLKYICELKEEGMSLNQIRDFCGQVDFTEGKGVQIKESNPLSIKALAQALMEHQQEQIQAMEERIISKMESYMSEQQINNRGLIDAVKEEVSITVDEIVNEKIEEVKDGYNKINEDLKEQKELLEEIKKTAYVSMDEIKNLSFKDDSKDSKLGKFFKWLR